MVGSGRGRWWTATSRSGASSSTRTKVGAARAATTNGGPGWLRPGAGGTPKRYRRNHPAISKAIFTGMPCAVGRDATPVHDLHGVNRVKDVNGVSGVSGLLLNGRALLRATVAAAAGLAAAPVFWKLPAYAATAKPFVTDYKSNVTASQTVDTNAAVRILSGMQTLWQTGTAWNTGTVLDTAVLRASMRYVTQATKSRTQAEADRAFIQDRQNQSYAAISGLGQLADSYKAIAKAVTSITTAPATTPPTTIDDTVPAGAPAGSALGAGAADSPLGQVVTLVNTLRGPFASGNPSKLAYQYPRPWRMTADSKVVDTGKLDAFGYPVYDSDVVVVPALLRQRGTNAADDGGFPSGHTNAFHLSALAFAYAVPERFQAFVTAAFDLSDTRIVAGMHS